MSTPHYKENYYWSRAGIMTVRARVVPSLDASDTLLCIKTLQ